MFIAAKRLIARNAFLGLAGRDRRYRRLVLLFFVEGLPCLRQMSLAKIRKFEDCLSGTVHGEVDHTYLTHDILLARCAGCHRLNFAYEKPLSFFLHHSHLHDWRIASVFFFYSLRMLPVSLVCFLFFHPCSAPRKSSDACMSSPKYNPTKPFTTVLFKSWNGLNFNAGSQNGDHSGIDSHRRTGIIFSLCLANSF